MKIVSKLFGLKKAADYQEAIRGLEDERRTSVERLQQLKLQRNSAPFEVGPDGLTA